MICGLGKPIDAARIKKHEAMCRFHINRHLQSGYLPPYLTTDDVMNRCRYEIVLALKKLDREKALGTKLEDPKRRERKLKEKRENPEAALEQAEKNVVYWQIDNYLKRLKWRNGFLTGPRKHRTRHIAFQTIEQLNREILVSRDDLADPFLQTAHDLLRADRRQNVEALYDNMTWLMKYRGPAAARDFFESVDSSLKEALESYIQLRASAVRAQRISPYECDGQLVAAESA